MILLRHFHIVTIDSGYWTAVSLTPLSLVQVIRRILSMTPLYQYDMVVLGDLKFERLLLS
jgi:hypothetical protein